jgi:hypothetical protein
MRPYVAALLFVACTARLSAQQLPPVVSGIPDAVPSPPIALVFGHPGDYRLEGLIAGAAIVGGAVTFLAVALCGQSDSCATGDAVLVSVGAFALGGLTGALIGGAIPKAPPPPATHGSLWTRASNARVRQLGETTDGALTRLKGIVSASLTYVAAGGEVARSKRANR